MGSWLRTWTPEQVAAADDKPRAFAEYCQQTAGIPWPTQKDMMILRRRSKEFFAHYPDVDWFTLCRVVQWCRSRKRRPPRVWMVVDEFRRAWRDGALPELDPSNRVDTDVEDGIERALNKETRPEWRRRLIGARGVDARREALTAWRQTALS